MSNRAHGCDRVCLLVVMVKVMRCIYEENERWSQYVRLDPPPFHSSRTYTNTNELNKQHISAIFANHTQRHLRRQGKWTTKLTLADAECWWSRFTGENRVNIVQYIVRPTDDIMYDVCIYCVVNYCWMEEHKEMENSAGWMAALINLYAGRRRSRRKIAFDVEWMLITGFTFRLSENMFSAKLLSIENYN